MEETESQCKTADFPAAEDGESVLFWVAPSPCIAYAGSADYELGQITNQAEN